MTNRICMALDLIDDPEMIQQYDRYHQEVWPEVLDSIRQSGIEVMEIYRTGNRLFMIMEVNDSFDLEKKAQFDTENPKVLEWERLMSTLQQPLRWAQPNQKWVPMQKIFEMYNEG